MKKYIEPDMEINDIPTQEVLMASGDLEEGESLWDNETPLIPFN